jgi:hypothetical protein
MADEFPAQPRPGAAMQPLADRPPGRFAQPVTPAGPVPRRPDRVADIRLRHRAFVFSVTTALVIATSALRTGPQRVPAVPPPGHWVSSKEQRPNG